MQRPVGVNVTEQVSEYRGILAQLAEPLRPAMPASTPMSFPSSLKASPVSIAMYTVRRDDDCVHSFTEPLPSPSVQPQARCRVSMGDGTEQVRQSTRNDRHAYRDNADAEHTVQQVTIGGQRCV